MQVEYNVWVTIERADEEADEFENLGMPVKLGAFPKLTSAISKVLTIMLAEMPPSGMEIADYRRWHSVAMEEERAAEEDETPRKFAVGDEVRVTATRSKGVVVGFCQRWFQVRLRDGNVGMFASHEIECLSD
jgi:hypothetical protein